MPPITSRRSAAGALLTVIVIAMVSPGTGTMAQKQWQPAKGPLMTRWAAEVSPTNVHPEYPRPQLVREKWLNLNGLWQFAPAKADGPPPIGVDLTKLQGGGQILVPFPPESSLSGVLKHMDRIWYRRTFTNPLGSAGAIGDAAAAGGGPRVMLRFGAVDWQCDVYVNGKQVGSHKGGYDPFSLDITSALNGIDRQELIVVVFDPTDSGTQPRGKQVNDPKGIFYTPTTGIWQTVWLEVVPAVAIEGVRVTCEIGADTKPQQAVARIDPTGRPIPSGYTLEAVVLDEGREVGRGSLEGKGSNGAGMEITVQDPRLWSPERPFLYELRLTLRRAERIVDQAASYFALRRISLGKDDSGVTRIFLNNEPYFAVGPLDQGFWPDGLYTAPTDEALRYDLEETKRLGFNLIRKHVKVEPDRWYYWCDRLGILVWQDMPSGDKYIGGSDPDITRTPESAKQFETELTAMIESLRNHPCIVMWVVFNEGWGQFDTARMVDFVRRLDPSRLVSNASGWTDRGVGDVIDMHAYPGPGAPRWETARAAVLGEFGGLGLSIDGHTWAKDSWGYQGMADADELTDRYVSLLRAVYKLRDTAGLSAAIYTQTTDVETECNGLLTYDRALVKPDAARVAKANRGVFPRMTTLLATAETDAALWRCTTSAPAASPGAAVTDWFQPGFDDAAWQRGASGFGKAGTPGSIIGTNWETPDIWIRRPFELPQTFSRSSSRGVRLRIHHDEDCEVYLNGVAAAALKGYTTAYTDARIEPGAAATLKPGQNTIAIHCRQTRGGQYIDAGLVELSQDEKQVHPPQR